MKKAGIFQEMINVNWGKGLYEWQKKKKRERERKEMIEKEE